MGAPLHPRTPSPRSSNPSVPTSKPTNWTKSSPSSTAKTLTKLSLKVWASSPPSQVVAPPQLVEPLKKPPLKKRKNPPKKSPTPIWDSIFLDKKHWKQDEFRIYKKFSFHLKIF